MAAPAKRVRFNIQQSITTPLYTQDPFRAYERQTRNLPFRGTIKTPQTYFQYTKDDWDMFADSTKYMIQRANNNSQALTSNGVAKKLSGNEFAESSIINKRKRRNRRKQPRFIGYTGGRFLNY